MNKMKHLKFKICETKPKTKVYMIYSRETGYSLGKIFWYNQWRQYIFLSWNGIIWTSSCIKEIDDFILKLKMQRKK